MSDSQAKPWDRFCEFVAESTRIFRAFSMALDAKKLLFAFCGVVVWGLGAMLINVLAPEAPWAIPVAGGIIAVGFVFLAFARSEGNMASKKFVLSLVGSILSIAVLVLLLIFAGRGVLLLNVYRVAWTLAVAAFFGTAVCRIAAIDAATEDSIGPRDAMRFALKKLSTSVWTLLTPVIAVFAFGVVMLVIGYLGRIPGVGHVVYTATGVLYILALLAGLFFAVMLLVYLPGLVLFQPAIGAEGSDSFDAISRAYSFVFGRPWRLLFYGIISFIYAKIVLSVVSVAFVWAGRIPNIFLAKGVGQKIGAKAAQLDLGAIFGMPYSLSPAGNVAGAIGYVKTTVGGSPFFGPVINAARNILGGQVYESFKAAGHPGGWFIIFWQYILLAIFLAFAGSFIYSLFTQIYFLMRKACEGTPLEEVYIEAPEEEQYAAEFEGEEKAAGEEGAEGTEEAKPAAPKRKPRAKKKKAEDKPLDLSAEEKPEGEGEDQK